jgi:23S rRNA pseudouridine1911/1915/1917 synthase
VALNDGYAYLDRFGARAEVSALDYLADRYRHSTREEWQLRFGRGEVELDGQRAHGGEQLRRGQLLCWHRPPWDEPEVPLDFELLHEDAQLIAVAKPSGLPTIPSGGFLKHTLLQRVRARWPEALPMHRLGRATTGLVLFARSSAVAAQLNRSWPEIDKRYRALASGVATDDAYRIEAPIGEVPHPRLGSVHGANAGGKPSRSDAQVLERRSHATLFEVRIRTGRPEQIRIHLAFIGHPLVGDPLFAPGGLPLAVDPGLPGDGGYWLHSESLSFVHPETGAMMRLHAPPPVTLATSSEPAPPR